MSRLLPRWRISSAARWNPASFARQTRSYLKGCVCCNNRTNSGRLKSGVKLTKGGIRQRPGSCEARRRCVRTWRCAKRLGKRGAARHEVLAAHPLARRTICSTSGAYIAADNPEAADRVEGEILDACERA